MKAITMRNHNHSSHLTKRFAMKYGKRVGLVLMAVLMCAPILRAEAENPTPTPTPKPISGSLSDVAGNIKLNKDAAGTKGDIVISNDNLSDVADKGVLTEVTKSGGGQKRRQLADVTGVEGEGEIPGFGDNDEKKQYWQGLYQQQLGLVTTIRNQIAMLDKEIPALWTDFYSRDDPAYRDGVIKPKLDEAMARRQKLEVDLQEAEASLAKVKEEARRDGGQPGWFRGFDQLPTPEPTRGVMPP